MKTRLVVYFFSNNDYVKRYEQDLVNAMKDGNNAMFCLGVSESDETDRKYRCANKFWNRQDKK